MTIRQAALVILTVFLGLVFYAYTQSGERVDRYACGDRLEIFGRDLRAFAKRNSGLFPTHLQELSGELPRCPASGRVPCYPRYEVSADRRFFGVWCPNNHADTWDGVFGVAGDVRYQSTITSLTRGTVSECIQQMESEGAYLREQSLAEPGTEPTLARYEGYRSFSCKFDHELCRRRDGTYEIVCASVNHMAEGLRPLQPRYDLRSQSIVSQPFERFDAPPPRPWILNPAFSLGVVLLTLMAIAFRHVFLKDERTSTERKIAL